MLKFKYMWKDECMADVTLDWDTYRVTVVNHTDDLIRRPFGANEKPDYEDLTHLITFRCFPMHRDNRKHLLRDIEVYSYDCFEIIRKTHGRQWDDHNWIKFKGEEDLTFKDINLRTQPSVQPEDPANPPKSCTTVYVKSDLPPNTVIPDPEEWEPIPPKDFVLTDTDKTLTPPCSKGNQAKWAKEGYWLKADFFGYEGLAETLASWIAAQSSLMEFAPVVPYNNCTITYPAIWDNLEEFASTVRTDDNTGAHIIEQVTDIETKHTHRGCYCPNMLAEDEECITFYRIIIAHSKNGEFSQEYDGMSCLDRIKYVMNIVQNETKIPNLGEWLTCVSEFDMFILNEDRHLNNLAVVRRSDGTYRLMDLFDNGSSFGHDRPPEVTPEQCLTQTRCKPFSSSFKEQVETLRSIYGPQFKLDVTLIAEDYPYPDMSLYPAEAVKRVTDIYSKQWSAYMSGPKYPNSYLYKAPRWKEQRTKAKAETSPAL